MTITKKSLFLQHISTKTHKASGPESEGTDSETTFKQDLCNALISANIPFKTLNNPGFKSFLKKYIDENIPDESTLRKNYLSRAYDDKIMEIKGNIGDGPIWISVDETTDSQGRYIANLIVGKLEKCKSNKSYLVASSELTEVNHASISRFVNDGIRLIWPQKNEDKVLLLLTDGASYMLKSGKSLKIFYPNMLHVTCIAHAINLLAERIRNLFPQVNKFISATKKIFIKAPSRVALYKAKLNIPLPPEPVLTRWGTWLKAAVFYANHCENIKKVKYKFYFLNYFNK